MLRSNSLFAKHLMLTVVLVLLAFAGAASLSAQTEHTIYYFHTSSDVDIQAGLVADSSGALYGTTTFGGTGWGSVFKISPPAAPGDPWTESTLYAFQHNNDGSNPYCSLVFDTKGNLYGTTFTGGSAGWTVFQLAPPAVQGGAWTESVTYTGNGSVEAGLAMDATGNLYGSTFAGQVFQLVPPAVSGGSWTYNAIYKLAINSSITRSLVLDSKGNLYGTSETGGTYGHGFVFGLKPPPPSGGKWTKINIYNFAGGSDGQYPASSLTITKTGVLYGTTEAGGAAGMGLVYSLTPPTTQGAPWTEAVLYNFQGGSDGAQPEGGVTVGNGGSLYGTTFYGSLGNGTVYKLTPPAGAGAPWTEAEVYSFTGISDGGQPIGNLLLQPHGVLYGTTSSPSAVVEVTQ